MASAALRHAVARSSALSSVVLKRRNGAFLTRMCASVKEKVGSVENEHTDLEKQCDGIIGSAKLDWSKLGFNFWPTAAHVELSCKVDDVQQLIPEEKCGGVDGEIDRRDHAPWDSSEINVVRHDSDGGGARIEMHAAATALHYGQSCFEGLKAFATYSPHAEDSVCVKLFRARASAARLRRSAQRLCMPPVPTHIFERACITAVQQNLAFVPPPNATAFKANAALYLRPLLLGTGARIGVAPSLEYKLIILATPVGAYYDNVSSSRQDDSGARAVLETSFARAARGGLGAVKTGANYAADLLPSERNRARGLPLTLYADACTGSLVEEFSTSNLVAIKYANAVKDSVTEIMKRATFVTPNSDNVLKSITNDAMQKLAKRAGLKVENREIRLNELRSFDEVGAVGTAVVVTALKSLQLGSRTQDTLRFNATNAVVLSALKNELIAIQRGQADDEFGWTTCCCLHPHA